MARDKLTPQRAREKSRKPGLHGDGGGLYLRVSKSSPHSKTTAASWVFRYMLTGNAREMGLGSFPAISLPTARVMAEEARAIKAGGQDPIVARESVRASQRVEDARSITFRECANAYMAAQAGKWRNEKHAKQWPATLEAHAMPVLGDIRVGAIDKALVIKVLDPIWGRMPETASRVRGRIEAVLDWAEARDYRSGSNPAAWKGRLDKVFPARSRVRKVAHHPALPYAEVPDFVSKLAMEEGAAARALEFTILTMGRTGEVVGAQWPEVDMNGALWTVPESKMKSGREHRVPLPPAAMNILRKQFKLTGGKGYIFPGRNPKKSLSNMAMLMLLKRMGRDDLTVHGFRSTAKDWASETTNFPDIVSEMALAHVVRDEVQAAYRRGELLEKRRKLMDAWAGYCTTPVRSGSVVSIAGQRRDG